MMTPFESECRVAGSRVLILLGAACVLSGHVACETAPAPAFIRPPALASYVPPAGLQPAGQQPAVAAPARMSMPVAPGAPVAAPSAMNPTPFRMTQQALPSQPFLALAPQAMPQAVEFSETGPQLFSGFFAGLAASFGIGFIITAKRMYDGMKTSVDTLDSGVGELELGMHPGRAGVPTMAAAGGDDDELSRRELFARAGAALAGFSAAQSASAKAGQFAKAGFFGQTDISSPYQPGGPQVGGQGTLAEPKSTYGFKAQGEILSTGYVNDVTREKASFKVSAKIVESQSANIDSKTWWLVRDNMRGQAYTMKANMLALNRLLPADKKKEADTAYAKFWKEIDQLDLACKKKEYDLAKKEYDDVLEALKKYKSIVSV